MDMGIDQAGIGIKPIRQEIDLFRINAVTKSSGGIDGRC
jgi:hypothetical protein